MQPTTGDSATAHDREVVEALDVARDLVKAGVPVFLAKGVAEEPGKFRLPPKWETSTPTLDVIDRWRPGDALCAVGGHAADFLDADLYNGGAASRDELVMGGAWPTSYGQQETPSGGTHDVIVPLRTGKATPVKGIDLQGGANDGTGRGFVYIAPTVRASKVTGELLPYRWTVRPDVALLAESADTDDSGSNLADLVRAKRSSPAPRSPGIDPFSDPNTQRRFTLAQAVEFCRPALEALAAAPDGSINDRLNVAAITLGHFRAHWTDDERERFLMRALEKTVYDGRTWKAADTIRSGFRAAEGDWRAVLVPDADESPDAPPDSDEQDRKQVQISTGPDTIRVLKAEIDGGLLPDTYVSDGRIVHMEQVSGGVPGAAVDEDAPLPMSASVVTAPSMAGLLAEHAFVYRLKYRKQPDGSMEPYEEETTPAAAALSAVLAAKTWPRVPPLVGIIGAPVLRRDGTLLQDSGYDRATGLYLARKVPLERIPDAPTGGQVKAAKDFLLKRFLVDFPWKSDADRANYLGLLVTPILRPYTRCLTPFGVIDATMPGSGKTILTGGPGMLYGQRVLPWPYAEEELRKSITAVMRETVGVCVFDNLAEGTVIDSAVLAQLITSPTWSDRELGSSRTLAATNNLLWLATGNNLRVGGDMATRSVLVRLDPDMPNPEYRTGFSIPNLDSWITYPANQRTVLQHVLVLAVDWTRANAPRSTDLTMRQFTPWAQAVGGLLAHHGIPGFLDNAADVRTIDEDESRWLAFLSHWRTRHGTRRMTASDLRRDGEPQFEYGREHDAWDGVFITTKNGRLPNAVGLGRMLTGQVSRWRGKYVLRSAPNDRGDRAEFWVETAGDTDEKAGDTE